MSRLFYSFDPGSDLTQSLYLKKALSPLQFQLCRIWKVFTDGLAGNKMIKQLK
jgi:hypothetical protein